MGGRGSSSGISAKGGGSAPKIGDEIYISDWFQGKIDIPEYAMKPDRGEIIQETEKAYKLYIKTETLDGEYDLSYKRWIPKSATKTEKQMREERAKENRKFERGKKRYEKMLDFAKKNGVKNVRVGMRKETILEKINKAGLKYEY